MQEDEIPIEIPITDVFDLHSVAPRDAKQAVEAYLGEAYRLGFRALRIVHGRGIGVQRDMVRAVLARTPLVVSFQDAPAEAGGWGATTVTLGETQTMHAAGDELSGLVRQYDAVLADAGCFADLTEEQFNWRDRPGRWSVGECLDHLIRTDRLYAGKVREGVERGKRDRMRGEGPFRYGALQTYLLKAMEPPARFRVKSPKAFVPTPRHEPRQKVEEFRAVNRELAELTQQARGLDLARVKVGSPLTDWWKWSLGVVLAACVAHDRRHLCQARQLMGLPGFPKG